MQYSLSGTVLFLVRWRCTQQQLTAIDDTMTRDSRGLSGEKAGNLTRNQHQSKVSFAFD